MYDASAESVWGDTLAGSAIKPVGWRHCSSCGRCVPRMDHHCAFINGAMGVPAALTLSAGCVGMGNYGHFVLWLAFVFAGCVYACIVSYAPFVDCVWGGVRGHDQRRH